MGADEEQAEEDLEGERVATESSEQIQSRDV